MTDTEIHQINLALENAGGDRALAAVSLSMPKAQLVDAITANPILRTKWMTPRKESDRTTPSEASTVHREMVKLEPIVGDEPMPLAVVEAVAKEDRALEKGLKGLKLDDDLVNLAVSLRDFQSKHFSRSMELMGGGLVRRYLKIEQAIDKIEVALDALATEDCAPEALMGLALKEQMLRKDRAQLIALQQSAFDRVNKAALTQAIIAQKQADTNGAGKAKVGKPGFGPKQRVQIVAQAGSVVNTGTN